MISKKLKDEMWGYCRMNDITNVDKFIERMAQQGFSVEKYGTEPNRPEINEVEVIKEVTVEVIKEVPVEVIKEIVVVKEVYVTDDDVVNKLQEEIVKLNEQLVIIKKNESTPKREKKEIKAPESTPRRSSIRWSPKDSGGKDNLYDD
jgi:hypothetical protein